MTRRLILRGNVIDLDDPNPQQLLLAGNWVLGAPIPPSGPGGDAYFVHTQVLAADVWPIIHALGKKPAVTVVDSADSTVIGDVIYLDDNRLELHFSAPFSGAAYLS